MCLQIIRKYTVNCMLNRKYQVLETGFEQFYCVCTYTSTEEMFLIELCTRFYFTSFFNPFTLAKFLFLLQPVHQLLIFNKSMWMAEEKDALLMPSNRKSKYDNESVSRQNMACTIFIYFWVGLFKRRH